ncbi:MAG: prepilin peptidase [Planctomycetota bacterium]|nr:prepilin peptidase [Planctomycetota bacterium]
MTAIPLETLEQILWIFSGVFGAIVGSFLNVCIYRIPIEGLKVNHPRGSFCPSCKAPVRWYDNVPVLAWIWLKGRCRDCSAGISVRYPLVEAFTSAMFLLAAYRFGGDILGSESVLAETFEVSQFLVLLGIWAWISILIVVSGIDFDHRIIPDRLSIPATCLVLLLSPWNPTILEPAAAVGSDSLVAALGAVDLGIAVLIGAAALGIGFQRLVPNWEGNRRKLSESVLAYVVGGLLGIVALHSLLDHLDPVPGSLIRIRASLAGAGIGAGVIYAIGKIGSIVFRKPAMGFGDVKWMGLLGATLGPLPILFSFLIACLLGSIIGIWVRVKRGSSYIPFGPFLSAGAISMLLMRPELEWLWESYLSLLR